MARRAFLGIFLLAAVVLSACAPKARLVPFDADGAHTRQVVVATSRTVTEDTPLDYGNGRSDRVHFADYRISIPPKRAIGQVTIPRGAPDPETEFLAAGYRVLPDEAAFIREINRALDALPPNERHLTLYVHGFNTSYAESVLVAAQVAEDYRIKGPKVLFAWPSADRITRYAYDRDSVLHARDRLVATLQAMAKTRARSIVILAHSIGGFLTMEALDRLRDRGDTRTLYRVRAAVLAEPDIDIDVFRSQLVGLDLRRLAVVVLASQRDFALRISSLLVGGHPRVGEARTRELLRRLGVIVVDVSNFDDGTLYQHKAFRRSPELVQLIASGKLTRALASGRLGENIVIEALSAVGRAALAVAYLPYSFATQ